MKSDLGISIEDLYRLSACPRPGDQAADVRPRRYPTYWIANVVEHCIEVYTDPFAAGAEPAYRQRHDYGPLDTIPFVLDGAEVGGLSVSELLP
jgi:hypothetical protein